MRSFGAQPQKGAKVRMMAEGLSTSNDEDPTPSDPDKEEYDSEEYSSDEQEDPMSRLSNQTGFSAQAMLPSGIGFNEVLELLRFLASQQESQPSGPPTGADSSSGMMGAQTSPQDLQMGSGPMSMLAGAPRRRPPSY